MPTAVCVILEEEHLVCRLRYRPGGSLIRSIVAMPKPHQKRPFGARRGAPAGTRAAAWRC